MDADDPLAWQVTERCTVAQVRIAPLLNIALDFINENNKHAYTNGWKMLSADLKDKAGSSVWLQETYDQSWCKDLCGYITWDQDVDGITMQAAQFRCAGLRTKALEIWVDPARPQEVFEYKYTCWESEEESAITPMPECTYQDARGRPLDYLGYTEVMAGPCPPGYEIVADCLFIAISAFMSFFLSLVVAPLLLLGGSHIYIRMAKKKAKAIEEEIMEEQEEATKWRKKKNVEDKAHKTKSKAEGKYDDVRAMYSEDLY